ncbi:MAG: carbon-nitrogen hydrolase family protein, partial [Pseudomonas sp.]|nr:carbon-nitrogen hydrolase family protein [Pseudomonas sp.]
MRPRSSLSITRAELIVLPETVTTGFTPGISPEELWDLMTEIPARGDASGTIVSDFADLVRELEAVVCVGTYERGPERGINYNASVLIDKDGSILGVYRKTHPFCSEAVSGGGWVTPG